MAFSEKEIQQIWEKGITVPNNDSRVYRKDECGAWIKRDMYGENGISLSYGWTIDHIVPISKGGSDSISNLRPLQWENNIFKSDGRDKCCVTSNGVHNKYL